MSRERMLPFWDGSWTPYYLCFFQELLAKRVAGRLQRLDRWMLLGVLASSAATGIGGWGLFAFEAGKTAWGVFVAAVVLAVIFHSAFSVPKRLQIAERAVREYGRLRLDMERFRQDLLLGMTEREATDRFGQLRRRYEDIFSETPSDPAENLTLRNEVQAELEARLGVEREAPAKTAAEVDDG